MASLPLTLEGWVPFVLIEFIPCEFVIDLQLYAAGFLNQPANLAGM